MRKRFGNAKVLLLTAMLFLLLFASLPVNAEAAWKRNSNGTYSWYNKGKKVHSQWIGDDYYVNAKGVRQTGWMMKGNKKYYFAKNGRLIRSKWIRVSKKMYYANADGVILRNGRKAVGKYYYAFDKKGVRLTGARTYRGKKYYFGLKTGRMLTNQWVKSGKHYYYYGADGAMVKNRWIGYYYAGKTGARLTKTWKDGRYLGSSGKALVGLQKLNGSWYYFNQETRKRVTNQTIEIGGKKYQFASNGKGKLVSGNKVPATGVNVERTYYTDPNVNDETLLASIIYCEAGNQSHTGKVAVGMVLMNRLHDSRFPSKLREIIYQKTQFTPARNGSLTRVLKNPSLVTADCKKAAKEVLQKYASYRPGKKMYLKVDNKNLLFNHLFFMTKPAYISCGLSSPYKQIGDHVFFRIWKR